MSRKLASVQVIKAIKPIEGADRIECVQVLNWNCVAKKGDFKVGDKVIYFEIDSLLPDIPIFEFLKGSSWSQKLNKYKISTHKFRNQMSQGLVIPIKDFPDIIKQIAVALDPTLVTNINKIKITKPEELEEGIDLTEILSIEKYEPPVSDGTLGEIISHEWYVPKTDEERIQVCAENVLPVYMNKNKNDWYATIKLDGTSCTAGLFDDAFLIGGRNQWYKDENMYTITVKKYKSNNGNLEEALKDYQKITGQYVVFQGELCGPGIQGNKLGLKEKEWYIFNAFISPTGGYDSYEKLDVYQMVSLCDTFGLKHVPIITGDDKFNFDSSKTIDETVNDLLKYVDDIKYKKYFENATPNQIAEGVVFRLNDTTNSFKVVSNKFLLKGGE